MIGPTSHMYMSERLRLHYVDWGNEGAPPLLLIHGHRDHCRNWDWVARRLRDRYHIIAPDLRGHGDSAWMVGGNYSVVHYVYDIAQLIHQKKWGPLTILGHSLGGSIALQYSGVYPENVARLISVEGFGPPDWYLKRRMSLGPQERTQQWVDQLRDLSGRTPRRYASIDEALSRMREANPHLTLEQGRHLTIHGVSQNEDGTFSWKFDNYVRAGSPYAFNLEEMYQIWGNIDCPTLLVRGTDSWETDPAEDGRAVHFKDVQTVSIKGAGHWVYHDQFDPFMTVLESFLG